MNEMEALYKTAISKDVSQGKAEKARQQDMVRKPRHLLQHLSERNWHIILKEGGQLTVTDALLNIRVTGCLLDILEADALPHEDEWSYVCLSSDWGQYRLCSSPLKKPPKGGFSFLSSVALNPRLRAAKYDESGHPRRAGHARLGGRQVHFPSK
jgi:hypothetical protein